MKKYRIQLLAAILLLTGCSQRLFPPNGSSIQPMALESLLKKKNVVLIDVRTAAEYEEGHLPDAQLMDVQQEAQFLQQAQALDVNGSYVLYCRSGRRSQVAKELLLKKGFKNVVDLEGGFLRWKGKTEK